MSVDTLANAKAELYGLLFSAGSPTVTGVTAVYDYEPQKFDGPVAVTVSTAGADPNHWLIAVRIYVSVAADSKSGQDTMDAVFPLVDAAANNGHFGPSNWDINPTDKGDYLVATCIYEVGREDQML